MQSQYYKCLAEFDQKVWTVSWPVWTVSWTVWTVSLMESKMSRLQWVAVSEVVLWMPGGGDGDTGLHNEFADRGFVYLICLSSGTGQQPGEVQEQ